jgi:hypothetical protein
MTSNLPAANATTGPGDGASRVAPLSALGYLGFDGPDAASFLQGQLSNDVEALAIGQCQWTSYNSPKGRMLASLLLARTGATTFRALVAADLAEGLRRRLSMYVLRAKVVVSDLSATGVRYGVVGAGARMGVARAFDVDLAPAQVIVAGDTLLAALPDGRVVLHVEAARVDTVRQRLEAIALPAPASAWEWAGVAAGVPHITLATQDQFVPQTANWDLVGGLNFQKGCYPGQEIVARMQYLGRLKERLQRFHVEADAVAGTRLFSASFGEQACGTVVNAAAAPEGGTDLLAVVQWSALDAGPMHIGAPDGPLLEPRALPYAVPEPVQLKRPEL